MLIKTLCTYMLELINKLSENVVTRKYETKKMHTIL